MGFILHMYTHFPEKVFSRFHQTDKGTEKAEHSLKEGN